MEVPEPSKTYSYIISARSGYSSVFFSKNALDLTQERVQRIVKEKRRARAPLQNSRQKFSEKQNFSIGLEVANIVFALVFLCELLCKLVGFGACEYWKDQFNVFDTVVVLVGLMLPPRD